MCWAKACEMLRLMKEDFLVDGVFVGFDVVDVVTTSTSTDTATTSTTTADAAATATTITSTDIHATA